MGGIQYKFYGSKDSWVCINIQGQRFIVQIMVDYRMKLATQLVVNKKRHSA